MAKMAEFNDRQKEEILHQSQAFWEQSTQYMSTFFGVVNEMERLARVLLPEELERKYAEFPDRSCLVPPDIRNNLASLRANIRMGLFKKKPYFRLWIAGHPNVRDERIEKAEETLQAQLDEANDGKGFPSQSDLAVYQAIYAGVTCVQTKWTQKYGRKPKRDEGNQIVIGSNGQPIFEYALISEYAETGPIDIRRVRMDPTAAEIKDIRLVGVHNLSTYSDLVRLNRTQGNHYSFDEQKVRESTFERSKYFEYVGQELDKVPDKSRVGLSFADRQVEVWSIRGLYRFEHPDGTWEFKDLIVEIGNRSHLLACKENDLPLEGWNTFDWPAVDAEHSRIFTLGIVEPARDTFIERFVKRNQSLDSANRNTYATLVGDSSACANLPDQVEVAGDQILKVDCQASNLNSVAAALTVLPRPQLGQDTFQHSEVLARETQTTMRLSN
jgi:hypothetical protein